MRNIISAIIVDPEKEKHDYSIIKTRKIFEYDEENFDLLVLEDLKDIYQKITDFKGFDCIITIGDVDCTNLNNAEFEVRKRWVHLEEFNKDAIVDSILYVFLGNIGRKRQNGEKLFSVFTCTFNTEIPIFDRLYNSLLSQTYRNWNWWILDDSTNDDILNHVKELNDRRIVLIKNETEHGNIGFNKHTIAMICDGDYLVEIDHDDEITPDCFQLINDAFIQYPDSDFVYSDSMEEMNGKTILYGEETWGCGEGTIREETILGTDTKVSASPYITPYSIRTIHLQPNHVRCWKSDFYHRINGHERSLCVLDDMEILVRTFLNGKMTKIDKTLYLQHEGEGSRESSNATTAQSKRFNEIQRTDSYLKWKYDSAIHNRILELGYEDTAWNEEGGYSDIWKDHEVTNIMCNIYKP